MGSSKKRIRLPAAVTVQITEGCNLRCKMCYFWGEKGIFSKTRIRKQPKIMDIELIERFVNELAPARPYYSLFGGEPLSHPKLREITRMIKKAGSFIETPTNGTLLTKQGEMLVETKFDQVRVSIDGRRELNDIQRGKGSFDKAIAGIEHLYELKQEFGSKTPQIGILLTITPINYLSVEDFIKNDLDLSALHMIEFQMENFITEDMGRKYTDFLKSEFGILSEDYWNGLVRSPEYFEKMDLAELSRQLNNSFKYLKEKKITHLSLPPTITSENLKAYFTAKWDQMTDCYERCQVPWLATDITVSGDIAPCHIFYDLIMGNLYERSFTEIWEGEKFQKYRDWMNIHKLMPICNGCCILYLYGNKIRKKK